MPGFDYEVSLVTIMGVSIIHTVHVQWFESHVEQCGIFKRSMGELRTVEESPKRHGNVRVEALGTGLNRQP